MQHHPTDRAQPFYIYEKTVNSIMTAYILKIMRQHESWPKLESKQDMELYDQPISIGTLLETAKHTSANTSYRLLRHTYVGYTHYLLC